MMSWLLSTSTADQSTPSSHIWLHNTKGLRFCLWNAQSILSQLTYFQSFVYTYNLDIIAITERLHNMHPTDLEPLAVSVCLTEIITVCLIYNPPNSSTMYYTSLLNYIHSLNLCSNIIIVGDLNVADANWDTYTGISGFTQDFCEAIFELNLLQLVNQPTHRKGNILDFIFTNQANVTNISTLPTLPCGFKSDHCIITFDLCSIPTNEDTKNLKPYPIYNYDKANWENMNEYITNFDFQIYYNSDNVNFLCEFLKTVIFNCIDLFVPKVFHKPNPHSVWFTPEIKHKLINQIHVLS